jgi:hypothetical protein
VTYDVNGYYFNIKCLNCPQGTIHWIPEYIGTDGERKSVDKNSHKIGKKRDRLSHGLEWGGNRDNLINEEWIREGHAVRTIVIQKATGLPHAKQAKIATADEACDESGRSLRASCKVEIANLIAASPDLLRASIKALQFLTGPSNRSSNEIATESREVSKALMESINKAQGINLRKVNW